MIRTLRTHKAAWLLLLALALIAPATHAAWWEFGRSESEPVLTDLKFNRANVLRVEDRAVLTREDLESGIITIRGRAEVRRGLIGLVEISLDGGQKWAKATLGERGMFTHEIRPDMERDYDFRIRATTTTGQKSDEEEHSFVLRVTASNPQEEVRQAFMELLRAYMREDRAAFMRLVSNDFEGNESALEDAITDDFRYLDNIRIEPQISRVAQIDRSYEVYFTFNRQIQSSRSGQILRDSAASIAGFVREGEGFKLSRLAAPLIFGLSGASEIATSVTGESVGKTIITLDPATGETSTGTQGANSTAGAANVETERANLKSILPMHHTSCDGFTFEYGNVETNVGCNTSMFNGDILLSANSLHLNSGVTAQRLSSSFDNVSLVPESGYSSSALHPVASGNVIALKLLNGKYVLLEITHLSVDSYGSNSDIRYKYQPDGSRNY